MTSQLLAALNWPAALLAGLVMVAAVTFVLRDWERTTALVTAGVTGAIGVLLWRFDVAASAQETGARLLETSPALHRFGFTLQLHGDALPPLILVFLTATAALVMAARFPQGQAFVPMTAMLLTGYTFWYLIIEAPIQTSLILPLGLVILAALSAIALQAGRPGNAGGPLRWMVAPVLAFPLFLVARWYIEQDGFGITTGSPERTAAALLTFGLLLLVAPVPLHSMQPATAESAPPMAMALLTLLYQLALIFLISHITLEFPFMQTLAPMNIWFSWAGLVTAIWAGVAAIGTTHPGRLLGYLSLHDWGLIILLLSVPGLRTWSLVAFLFVLRVVSLLSAAAGLAAIEFHVGDMGSKRLEGVGVRVPWNSAAYLLGGLGLVGFPLSAGFAGHWAALQLVAASDWRPAGAVLVASGAAILALIRMARTLYGPQADPTVPRERFASVAAAIAVIVITVTIAVAPQLLNGPVSRAILAFGV